MTRAYYKTIKALSIFALLMFCASVLGQTSTRYDWNAQTINSSAPLPGGLYPVLALPSIPVQICNAPATGVPCTNLATTYTDSTAGTACPSGTQLTRPGSNVCVANTDAEGAFGAWVLPGCYQYTLVASYGSYGPYDFCVGGTSVINPGTGGWPAFYDGTGTTTQIHSLSPAEAQAIIGTASVIESSVNGEIDVMAAPYNAKGDCTTDDHDAIAAAFAAADAVANAGANGLPTVVFPVPPGGCYLTSTLTWYGEPIRGIAQTGSVPRQDGAAIVIRGKPGQDILHVPDPSDVSYDFNKPWSIENIAFDVDNTTAGSFAHRWPGRWFNDGAITASSAIFTSANGSINCSDVGQAILVKGAGVSGADLSTTISSVTPCWALGSVQTASWQVVTLAASASTTVTAAQTYVSVLGLPVTTTIGNAAIAMDDRDGNPANWINPSQSAGNLYTNLWNVGFSSVSGTYTNDAAIYTQGVWGFYGMDAKNINVRNMQYGVVQGTAESNSYYQSSANDFAVWEHMSMESMWTPWIQYNGQFTHITDTEITSTNGPVFSAVGNQWGDHNGGARINIQEFEGNTGGYGFQLAFMNASDFSGTNFGGASGSVANINTSNMICDGCGLAGSTLNVGGNLNQIQLSSTGTGSITVNDTGLGNNIIGSYYTSPADDIPNAYALARSKVKSTYPLAGKITSNFIWDGNTSTPYNDDDLFIWPQDIIFNKTLGAYATYVAADANAVTGYHLAIPSGKSFANFAQYSNPSTNSLGVITVGTTLPAGKGILYFRASCNSGSTFTLNIAVSSPFSSPASGTYSCTTSYAIYSLAYDLTSYSGKNVSVYVPSGSTPWLDWFAFRPNQASYNGYTPAPVDSPTFTGTATTPNLTISGITGSTQCLQANSSGSVSGSGASCGSGLSGMNSGQVAIAGSSNTITSSKALAGSGTGIVTGPTSDGADGNVVVFNGTTGGIKDSSTLLTALANLASPTFTGTVTIPTLTATTYEVGGVATTINRNVIHASIDGAPLTASQDFGSYVPAVGQTVTIPTGCTNSVARAGVAATASTTLTIWSCSSAFGTCTNSGTIVFGAGGTTGTFTCASSITLNGSSGNGLYIEGPVTPDATLGYLAVALYGTHN
jgi:hypothetical protein